MGKKKEKVKEGKIRNEWLAKERKKRKNTKNGSSRGVKRVKERGKGKKKERFMRGKYSLNG